MEHVVVFGAGALSLGFLGPELSKDYKLTFVDISAKKDFLERLHKSESYRVNIVGPFSIVEEIKGTNGINIDSSCGRNELEEALSNARIVLTAVGVTNLSHVASLLGPVLRRRNQAELVILCGENGKDVAKRFAHQIETFTGLRLPGSVRVGDTVMGRMCRIDTVGQNTGGVATVCQGIDWAVIAEPFWGIPVDKSAVDGKVLSSKAFQLMEGDEFSAWEDIKLYGHNGVHAFLGYLGKLRGYSYYYECGKDGELMEMARRMLEDEVRNAIFTRYSAIGSSEYRNYTTALLRRITCPFFGDTIDRGCRRSKEKLLPEERFISGTRFISEMGCTPKYYALMTAAALHVSISERSLQNDVEDVLVSHCGLDRTKERHLIDLVRESYRHFSS
jgi:mannitol-1-phosphate/altronate dehydrogenase